MSKINELSTKLATLLGKINTAVSSKLDATGTAVNSDKLQGMSLGAVRDLAATDAVEQIAEQNADKVGLRGEVAYFEHDNSPLAVKGFPLLTPVNLVGSDADLNTAKASTVPFSEVFNKWRRISHKTSGIFPANPAELEGWEYNEATQLVNSTINSESVIGLISHDRFEDYTFEAVMKSTDGDNDGIGLCLAFTKVGSREYTVIAMVDGGGLAEDGTIPNGDVAKLVIAVNYGQGAAWGHQVLASIPLGISSQGWSNGADLVNGVKIRAVRQNSGALQVTCTKANGDPWPNPVQWDGMLPELFRGPCAIGFVAYSQPLATWTVQQMPTAKHDIIDTRNNDVHRWQNNAWTVVGKMTEHEVMMPGRIYKDVFASPYTAFYLDHDGTCYVLGGPQQIAL